MRRNTAMAIFMTLLYMAWCCTLHAQSLVAHKGKVKEGYNFWLYSPANEENPKPLVIFLHGASLCGTNIDKVRRYGTIDAVEKGREIDAYILAPQNPGGAWKPSRIMNIVEWVKQNNNVDSTRIYVLGMSLGGYGTIDLAATHPKEIAAAMAFCGGGTQADYSGLTEVPLWIVHGTADKAVSVKCSDAVVNEMKKVKDGTKRLHYDRLKGVNHSLLARIFYMVECYEWLFKHSLSDKEREISPKYEISKKTLTKAVYKGTTSHKKPGLIKADKTN